MSIACIIRGCIVFVLAVLFAIFPSSKAQLEQPIALPAPSNFSTSWANNSFAADLDIACDGKEYGLISDLKSCVDAANTIPPFDKKQTIGLRKRGKFDVNLPQRYISSDGLCAIDLEINPWAASAQASSLEIAIAATSIIRLCVRGSDQPTGGIARTVGTDKNLAVILTTYKPTVRCGARAEGSPQRFSCNSIVNGMKADKNRESFGRASGHAKNHLPITFYSPDGRCHLRVDSDEPGITDYTTWYNIWLAAVAVDGMCLRFKKSGRASVNDTHFTFVEVAAGPG